MNTHIWSRDYEFTTASGVFAREGLDKATGILLAASTTPVGKQTILDLGCGWGPIACAIAVEDPDATVYAVDTNERALDLVRVNAERAGVAERVIASLPDGVPQDIDFDSIWSNPPIRVGKQSLHELLLRWLPRLAPDGSARLVVGKNLGSDSLQSWLIEQGWPTKRETSVKGFRVLRVERS
ncbi:MAG: methyltransferase [Propionibacteriales bacterium]|nr:methyltransferase [Propionibacteriales bacterium]